MAVRSSRPGEDPALQRMAAVLTGGAAHYDFSGETLFVWDVGDGRPGGFLSLSVRPWSEGASDAPVPHVEGWFVEPELRRRGVGTALMDAAERWCRGAGFAEFCSDAETRNRPSLAAHRKLGFEPTLRLQYFRKPLG